MKSLACHQTDPRYPGRRRLRTPGPGYRAAALSAALLGSGLLSGGPAAAPASGPSEAFFAEPVTGRRVTEYQIELPTQRTEKRTFSIPADCVEVMRCVDEGAVYRSSVIDRRLWHKAESDCRFYSFLYRHPQQIIADYVSDYDFRNARLSDLPIDQRCADGSPAEGGTGCNPAATDPFGMLHYFPLGEPPHGLDSDHEVADCELKDGVFRGRLYIDGDHIHCDAGPAAPTLRLIAVDFADVNGDQYLDAVLRFVPIGPGAARAPLTLPLTRTEPEGPFHVPQLDSAPPPITPLEDR